MVQIHPKRFPQRIVKKLHARSVGPLKILTKLNDNTYVTNLLEDFEISFTFNIEDLVDYKGPDLNPISSLVDEPTLSHFLRDPTSLTLRY